jgi:hypothetical protein
LSLTIDSASTSITYDIISGSVENCFDSPNACVPILVSAITNSPAAQYQRLVIVGGTKRDETAGSRDGHKASTGVLEFGRKEY